MAEPASALISPEMPATPSGALRIKEVMAFPISVPLPVEAQVTLGVGRTVKRDAVVVRIRTRDGLTGWSESHHVRASSAIVAMVDEVLADRIIGLDGSDIVALNATMRRALMLTQGSGIDMALWDIKAKAAGWPLCRLLDGAPKPVRAYAGGVAPGWGDPEDLSAEAQNLVGKGYRALKLRVGDSVERDTQRLRAVRDAVGPDIVLMADANSLYSAHEARRIMPVLGALALRWLEEPFMPQEARRYADLAGHATVPLAAGENLITRQDFAGLIYFMVSGKSLMMSAIYAVAATILSSLLRKETSIKMLDVLGGLEKTAYSILIVAIPCAAAGLIIGIIVQTGVGLKFTGFVLSLAEGSLLLSLIAVMVACIILGMGMPTVSAYIMVAILMAPALLQLDLNLLSVHLFIFYFALLSFVTPPVALASYAAAALAGTDSTKTGLQAFKLTIPGFIIPFAFIYNPALVMEGEWLDIIVVVASCLVGVYALSTTVVGMGLRRMGLASRAIAFTSAILLITPEWITDISGFALFAGVLLWQSRQPEDPLPRPSDIENQMPGTQRPQTE